MMGVGAFLNQHSFLISGLVVLLIAASVLAGRGPRGWLIWAGLALVLGAVWLILRIGPTNQLDSTAAIDSAVSSGRPALVKFYSDY